MTDVNFLVYIFATTLFEETEVEGKGWRSSSSEYFKNGECVTDGTCQLYGNKHNLFWREFQENAPKE
jgi:hypothetical protein